MSFLRSLEKGIKAFTNEAAKPESFYKGEAFEEYIRQFTLPTKDYDLLHKTHDYNNNKKDFVESSLYPDYLFRDKRTGKEFFVEVKFRNGFYDNKNMISWCNYNQLKRYKEIDEQGKKVFIVLGLGDYPKRPHALFLFPLSGCNFCKLYDSFLEKYSFYPDKPVFSSYLWKLK